MGTSASYHPSLKGKPEWGNFSGNVTSGCNGQDLDDNRMDSMLGKYMNVIGGARKVGSGGSPIMGRAGLKSAGNLGGFLGSLISTNFDIEKSLYEIGITDLSNKSLSDIVNNLIEYCSGPASTIDDKAAKEATRLMLEEMVGKANSIDSLKEQLKKSLNEDTLEELIIKYFGYYVFEHLSVMFYEKLAKQKGEQNRGKLFKRIKEFILEKLKSVNKKAPLKNINWSSNKAKDLINTILKNVLTVFE